MSRIDELLNELDEKETLDIGISMNKEKKQRIEAMIAAGIQNESKNEKASSDTIKIEKRRSKRKIFIVLLAATLLLGMTVYAAEKKEWDIAIVNFMGISDTDTVQLEDGVVEIGASALTSKVTMKAVTSVGDKNSAYIRIDTDYKLPQSFNEKTDYILTNGWNTSITNKKMMPVDHGGTMMYFNNDGFLSFMIYIGNCDGINRKNVTITLSDIYLYHDLGADEADEPDHGTLLLKGEWILSWKYNYRSNVNTYYPIKKVISNGEACLVTKIEISPISILAESLKNPNNGSTETSQLLIKNITMKDGSVVEFDPESTSGGCKNNIYLEGYRDVTEMGEVIDPQKVYSVTIGDTEIIL